MTHSAQADSPVICFSDLRSIKNSLLFVRAMTFVLMHPVKSFSCESQPSRGFDDELHFPLAQRKNRTQKIAATAAVKQTDDSEYLIGLHRTSCVSDITRSLKKEYPGRKFRRPHQNHDRDRKTNRAPRAVKRISEKKRPRIISAAY